LINREVINVLLEVVKADRYCYAGISTEVDESCGLLGLAIQAGSKLSSSEL